MGIHRNPAVVHRGDLRAFEAHRMCDHQNVERAAPDEPKDGYSMASKQGSYFVHSHKIGIGVRELSTTTLGELKRAPKS